MKVWAVEVCQDDEYGCMVLWGVFASEESARAAAEAEGLQCEDRGEDYCFRDDYYAVSAWDVK